jgi:hypothetical protein
VIYYVLNPAHSSDEAALAINLIHRSYSVFSVSRST